MSSDTLPPPEPLATPRPAFPLLSTALSTALSSPPSLSPSGELHTVQPSVRLNYLQMSLGELRDHTTRLGALSAVLPGTPGRTADNDYELGLALQILDFREHPAPTVPGVRLEIERRGARPDAPA